MALKLLNVAMNDGYWLMFQNCHLLIPFLYDLEKILDRMDKIHPDFRLWLSTEATPSFPVAIIQRSLKGKTKSFFLVITAKNSFLGVNNIFSGHRTTRRIEAKYKKYL